MMRSISKIIILTLGIFLFSLAIEAGALPNPSSSIALPDISGLAWIADDRFLAVHDAKDPLSPRISLLRLPDRRRPLSWQVIDMDWPAPMGASQDLESVTAIPETNLFLLAESGARESYRRLFLVAYEGEKVKMIAQTNWPVSIENVEAIAVTRLEDDYLFLYAERAEGRGSTEIRWATMTLNPLRFGKFQAVSFSSPFGGGKHFRQISDLTLDRQQTLYIASTYDPGNEDAFRSAIYKIGNISRDKSVILDSQPQKLGEIDGLKVEGLAIQALGTIDQPFFGTDDENYGGVFRPLTGLDKDRSSNPEKTGSSRSSDRH